ncbi:MAG: hypothetical protein ACRD0H_25195, partial [Actinomycetes bacterium]
MTFDGFGWFPLLRHYLRHLRHLRQVGIGCGAGPGGLPGEDESGHAVLGLFGVGMGDPPVVFGVVAGELSGRVVDGVAAGRALGG